MSHPEGYSKQNVLFKTKSRKIKKEKRACPTVLTMNIFCFQYFVSHGLASSGNPRENSLNMHLETINVLPVLLL